MNMIDKKEWVAPESNKTDTLNPKMGIVPVTTSVSLSDSLGTSEWICMVRNGLSAFPCHEAPTFAVQSILK